MSPVKEVKQSLLNASCRLIALLVPVIFCNAVHGQTAVTLQAPNLAGPVSGSLAGKAGVSASGASTYSVPITVPPGTAGVVPTISLDYSSQFGMSSMGQGWRIDGMSQISRCPKTIAQDGVRRGIALTAEDQFCLDNQRLLMLPSSGIHGATAEYRLQIDAQSKVRAFGSDPAKGPDYWEIRTKAGLIFTYGKTADATIEAQGVGRPVLTWALSRVMDRRGNYYDVRYTKINTNRQGEFYLDRILYTGHIDQSGNAAGNRSPYNAVQFVYEDRPDLQLGFVAGSRITGSKRLTAVRTRTLTDADGAGGNLVSDYRIAYTIDPANGRSLVTSISDCDGLGNCLSPTSFAWSVRDTSANTLNAAGSGNWGGPQVTFTTNQVDGEKSQQVRNQVIAGDFNGDGRTDLMRGDGSGNWQVCLSQGSGFSCQNWSGPAVLTRDALTGDFNGDGKTDLAVYPKVDGPGNWTMCLSTGSGFSCSTWAGYGATYRYSNGEVTGALVGDFNGDGRDDIALAGVNSGSELICKSTGSGFEGGCGSYPGSYAFIYYAKLASDDFIQAFATSQMAGDIDGDGRTDIIHLQGFRRQPTVYPAGSWAGLRATDTGFQPFGVRSTGQLLEDGVPSPGTSKFTDVTADSFAPLSDVVNGYISDGQGGIDRVELCRSNGTTLMTCANLPASGWISPLVSQVADFDGDGRPDVLMSDGRLCQLAVSAYGDSNVDQYSFNCAPWTFPTYPANGRQSVWGDFNGDGRMDLATYVETSSSTGYWTIGLSGHGGFQNLLDTVTNGVGQQTRFVYKRLNDPSIYTIGADLPYPKAPLRGSGPVVASMQTGNGVGGWLTTDFQYEANRTDLSGRGVLGFQKRRAIDRAKNITTQTTVSQDYPTIGMPTEIRATQANGIVLSLESSTYDSVATVAGALCPYAKNSSKQLKDLNGTPISTVTASVNTGGIDAYCNITNATDTISTSDGASFSTTTVSDYVNRTDTWLIGLPSTSTVSKTAFQPYANPTPASLVLKLCSTTVPSTAAGSMSCTLGNLGQTAASSIGYTSGSGTTTTGPVSCESGSDDCGIVKVTSGGTAGSYTGTLTATPSPAGGAVSRVYAIVVKSPPMLTLTSCSTSPPSTTAGKMTCTIGNGGQTAATGIAYGYGSGVSASGPSSCAAGNANCGTVVVTSNAAAGNYGGTLTATPTPSGINATQSYAIVVNTPPALTLTSCSTSSPSTTAGVLSCTLGNSGQTTASSIGYSSGSGTTATGPASCAAGNANCGTATVTSSAVAGNYSGSLAVTPTPTGSSASASYAIVVNTPTALTLTNCSTSSASTAAGTMSCRLGNSGQTAASGISYGSGSGTSATGPASCAAGNANCGNVTVTSNAAAGTYTGTLTATPTPAVGAVSAGYTIVVNTPPVLTLSNCNTSSPSTGAGSMSCTVGNSGQTAASGIGYGAGTGTTVAGPSSCAAGSTNCGTVIVSSTATAATYSGILSVTPTPAGTVATKAYTIVVNTPPALTLTNCSTSAPSTASGAMSCTLGNSGQTSASSIGFGSGGGTSVAGPSGCAAGNANCGTVTVTSSAAAGSYSGTLTATPTPAGSAASAGYAIVVNTPPALTLTNCATSSPGTAAATMTCTLGNGGQTSASGVSYGAGGGATITGPANCTAGNPSCGTVKVTSGTTAGSYSGTLTATPVPSGSVASAGYTLVVLTPPALGFSSCSSSSPSTAVATMSCVLSNGGQASTAVNYGVGAGVSISGPGSCAGNTGNCGTVTVTTSSTPGPYTGTLSALGTAGGNGASAGYSLRVWSNGTTISVSPGILDWGTVTGGGSQKSVTVQNTGLAPTTLSWGVTYTSGSIGMGGYSTAGAQTTCVSGQTLDIGGNCTIAVTFTSQCTTHGSRNGLLNVSGSGATQVSATLAANSQRSTSCN
ncbi:FG-GAP-like repeat-containing protein [Paucibacter sp. R3-3]|uniref:FG-GAP-like repeat-containing protein n=1 Tax=Roseateles agri TaxID=3098619 RepID=A0ABU5DC37_9BURK|nr:FG-GAP-like repeat-containing protein [Paucibacter sp. R3-3]MDY0743341.1 FG-GAP-like repeat-containing protein [Paucibacter sp. R3-3]